MSGPIGGWKADDFYVGMRIKYFSKLEQKELIAQVARVVPEDDLLYVKREVRSNLVRWPSVIPIRIVTVALDPPKGFIKNNPNHSFKFNRGE